MVCALSAVAWGAAFVAFIEPVSVAVSMLGVLLLGPAWAMAFCLASSDDDFPEDARWRRAEWLRVLPWTFVLAPLVLPGMVLLVQFFRDSRADHGQTWLGSGRSRPGEGRDEYR